MFVGGISRLFFISLNIFLIIMALFCNLSPPQPFSAVYFPHSIISRIRPAALASFFLIPSIFCASTRRRHPHFCMFDPPFSSHFPPLINLFVCFSRTVSFYPYLCTFDPPPSLLLISFVFAQQNPPPSCTPTASYSCIIFSAVDPPPTLALSLLAAYILMPLRPSAINYLSNDPVPVPHFFLQ